MTDIVDQLRDRAYSGKAGDPLCERAAEVIDRLRAERRWIPVSERLPDRGDTIWIFDRDGVALGEFHGEYGFQTYGASCDREGLNSETLFDVTHWMELQEPEPPEVK